MVAAGGDVTVKKKVKKIKNIPAEAGAEALSNKKVKKQKGTDTGEVTVEKKKKKKRKAETEAEAVVSDEPVIKKKKVKKSEPEREGPSPAGSDSAESEQCALDVSDSKPAHHLALDNFRLSPAIKDLLRQKGIESLFSIQAQTLTSVLDGFDLVGRAR